MFQEYCKDCLPVKRRTHLPFHFGYYLEKFLPSLPQHLSLFSKPFKDRFWLFILKTLAICGLVSFREDIVERDFRNRSLIFFKEAKKRDLDLRAIYFLGKPLREFLLDFKGKRYLYESIPLTLFENTSKEWDSKEKLKELLREKGFPHAPGQTFTSKSQGLEYGLELGFPLVVKPVSGSLSQHVTHGIEDLEGLSKAIDAAKVYRPDFVVERFVEGMLFRATVVGKEKVFISKKERANVVGDGSSTIKELIEQKNEHESRGSTREKNTTLHEIPQGKVLERNLKEQNLHLNNVPEKGERIFLHEKYILSQGCDVLNFRGGAHPTVEEMFLELSRILDTDLVGFDFICQNIDEPPEAQECAVIEANSLPYIDMHQYPSHGKGRPVAEVVWDIVLEKVS